MHENQKKGSDYLLDNVKISLAAARVNAGYTQAEVAKMLHKTPQTIVNWENGKSLIDTANFVFLCELYKIPQSFIFVPNKSI